MTNMIRVALGIMAKAPVPGWTKTRLSPPLSEDAAAALHLAMLRDTVEAAGEAPTVVFAAPEQDGVRVLQDLFPRASVHAQVGEDLGARMEHAVSTLLAQGHEAAALCGTDAPHAPLGAALERMRVQARSGRVFLGPAHDGGYWFIGMSRAWPDLFRGITWGTPGVLEATMQRCIDHGADVVDVGDATDVDDVNALRTAAPLLAKCSHTSAWLAAHPSF